MEMVKELNCIQEPSTGVNFYYTVHMTVTLWKRNQLFLETHQL